VVVVVSRDVVVAGLAGGVGVTEGREGNGK
jgi:hypothetical protein